MNIHNKLKDLGFKKCGFYRSEKNKEEGWKMVRDDVEVYFNIVDGKYIRKTRFKNHSKSSAVYKMKMNTKVTLWAFIKHHNLWEILIEDKNRDSFDSDRIKRIWSQRIQPPKSKADIINLLPTDIRRDILLNQLFN